MSLFPELFKKASSTLLLYSAKLEQGPVINFTFLANEVQDFSAGRIIPMLIQEWMKFRTLLPSAIIIWLPTHPISERQRRAVGPGPHGFIIISSFQTDPHNVTQRYFLNQKGSFTFRKNADQMSVVFSAVSFRAEPVRDTAGR